MKVTLDKDQLEEIMVDLKRQSEDGKEFRTTVRVDGQLKSIELIEVTLIFWQELKKARRW